MKLEEMGYKSSVPALVENNSLHYNDDVPDARLVLVAPLSLWTSFFVALYLWFAMLTLGGDLCNFQEFNNSECSAD